jgi:hypothetical protein
MGELIGFHGRSCRPGRGTRRPTIVCFGDSHTQGVYGPCWVDTLQERYPHIRFVNQGINGEVLERWVDPHAHAA